MTYKFKITAIFKLNNSIELTDNNGNIFYYKFNHETGIPIDLKVGDTFGLLKQGLTRLKGDLCN